jgi:hypothetical protein
LNTSLGLSVPKAIEATRKFTRNADWLVWS